MPKNQGDIPKCTVRCRSYTRIHSIFGAEKKMVKKFRKRAAKSRTNCVNFSNFAALYLGTRIVLPDDQGTK